MTSAKRQEHIQGIVDRCKLALTFAESAKGASENSSMTRMMIATTKQAHDAACEYSKAIIDEQAKAKQA